MGILNHNWNLHRSRGGWSIIRAVALGFVMALGNCPAAGSPAPVDEYKVKAAFLFNFVKFVEWPAGTFRRSNEQIVICILGEDPFGSSLEDTVAGRAIDGRSLVVRHIPNMKRAVGCHVLFVSFAENKRSVPMFGELKMPGMLTIGESGVTGEGGVIINFKPDGGKIRFEINVQTAERGNLRINPQLLNLAHIVGSNPK